MTRDQAADGGLGRQGATAEDPERSPEEPAVGNRPPGRAARGPDEGPARDGGSGLEADDEAAEEEVGGGD